jgi:hypothetical protein
VRTPRSATTTPPSGGSRDLRYVIAIEAIAPDSATVAIDRQWVRDTWDALRPAAVGSGSYVNLMAETPEDALRSSYGARKFERLARIKGVYDPGNLFHVNANIKPA